MISTEIRNKSENNLQISTVMRGFSKLSLEGKQVDQTSIIGNTMTPDYKTTTVYNENGYGNNYNTSNLFFDSTTRAFVEDFNESNSGTGDELYFSFFIYCCLMAFTNYLYRIQFKCFIRV